MQLLDQVSHHFDKGLGSKMRHDAARFVLRLQDRTRPAMTEETVTIEVKLSPIIAQLLAVLDRDVAHLPRPPVPEPPKLTREELLAMSDDEREALRASGRGATARA